MQIEINITGCTAPEAVRRCGTAVRQQNEWRDGKTFAFAGVRTDGNGQTIATYKLMQE